MASDLNIVITIGAKDIARDSYAVQLQHKGKPIADSWAQIDRQALLEAEFTYNPHDYGMKLYNAIFVGDVDRAYQRLIGQSGSDAAIRVQLVIHRDAPELHALPWERLFHLFGDKETPLAADARTPFSRFLVSGASDQTTVQERPLRLLVAIANPSGLPEALSPIDVVGEVESLAGVLTELFGRIQGTLLAGRTELPEDLRQRLVIKGWNLHDGVTSWQAIQRWLLNHHILHVLAHGQFKKRGLNSMGTAYLMLEHEGSDKIACGSLDRIPDEDIVTGLAGINPLPQLIFLAACDTAKRPQEDAIVKGSNPFVGLGPKLVQAGVPAVVAMQNLVPISLARSMAADFYRRLFEHGQVDRALNEARNLVYKSKQFEWAIPVLFLRLSNGQLFTPIKNGEAFDFEPETVFVRSGPFLMGTHPAAGVPENETPLHPVLLGDYYIGRYPVTNKEYAEFIRQVKTQNVPSNAGWFNRKPPPDRLDHPVVGVSWHDAVAYCVWLSEQTSRHYRLPSEAEWEKAARGTNGQRYPWGETWSDRCVNVNSPSTTSVADHPFGVSPFGCEDMVGNVEEWTRTLWGNQWTPAEFGYPYNENDGRELTTADDLPTQGRVVHRGGSYKSQAGDPYCALRDCAIPSSRTTWRGFRIVMEVRGYGQN